mmetsp:Transcript_13539/g.27241  ORF Transcript_13539/g.27241 Transcript_13539/m.27241 type:complete len:812 (-) Transcript_13539:287-2722(-)
MKAVEASISQKVCRACLKHGVAAGKDADKVPILSLQFIALLMRTQLNREHYINPSIPPAKDVFSMVVSHSKFDQLFTDIENSEDDRTESKVKIKEAILRLMITCNLISTDGIAIDPSTWKVIFTSFDAGVCTLDILIRKLISVCSEDYIPFMDELRWKGCDTERQEQNVTRKFDWFVDALDATRIRATISRFPIDDEVNPNISLDDICAEQPSHRQAEKTSMETNQVLIELFKLNRQNNLIDTSIKHGEARTLEPYSPAFVLPLILKTIESGMSPNKTITSEKNSTYRSRDNEENQELMSPWNFSKSSISSIQQLCEKGAVSLCMASLSSLCEKVRCYAVSIFGLILRASHTIYALDSSSWRDRPQLVMILNSVQRSLLLRKACDETDSVVPRLTPIIARFLARAAFVLPKPDDALYVSMNRYFLKSEADHGAFQDMKRLPAFMSLFCSSSDDPNQSRAERMWGLQMLSSGVVDASCYRLLTSCHAPELILSSFENIRLSQASCEAKGAETCLLLESLTSMIDHGGYGAHVHLIRRCGLLSWMGSLCTSRSLTAAFPTERSQILFCQLTNSLFETVFCTSQLKSSELIDEICALIQPLVDLCLLPCHPGQPSPDVYQASFLALRALSIGLRQMKDNGVSFPEILPLGASIESSLRILRITDDSTKALSMHTLCSLPVSLTTDLKQETTQNLILLMLQIFDNISDNTDSSSSPRIIGEMDQFIPLLLQRVALLIEQCEIGSTPTNPIVKQIMTKLFTLRCNPKVSDADVQALRSRCLRLLMTHDIVYNGVGDIRFLEGIIWKELFEDETSKP